jgi:hypothetical protein
VTRPTHDPAPPSIKLALPSDVVLSRMSGPYDMTALVRLALLAPNGETLGLADLLESLRSSGVASSNGHGLVGEHNVKLLMQRLIAAVVAKLPRVRHAGKAGFGPQSYALTGSGSPAVTR